MAARTEQADRVFSNRTADLNPEHQRQIVPWLSGGTRRPKGKEQHFSRVEQHKLRGCLAQLIIYYKTVAWQNCHNEEKILYSSSLLKQDAGTWMLLFAEERIP